MVVLERSQMKVEKLGEFQDGILNYSSLTRQWTRPESLGGWSSPADRWSKQQTQALGYNPPLSRSRGSCVSTSSALCRSSWHGLRTGRVWRSSWSPHGDTARQRRPWPCCPRSRPGQWWLMDDFQRETCRVRFNCRNLSHYLWPTTTSYLLSCIMFISMSPNSTWP